MKWTNEKLKWLLDHWNELHNRNPMEYESPYLEEVDDDGRTEEEQRAD